VIATRTPSTWALASRASPGAPRATRSWTAWSTTCFRDLPVATPALIRRLGGVATQRLRPPPPHPLG
jgi:hypothetical protein